MQSFALVLDANVIVPVAATDLLLRLAARELFRTLWSARIMDEPFHSIRKIHPEFTDVQIRKRLTALNEAFDDALVIGWENIEGSLDLPDIDDRHVLACAIVGGADAIVTNNMDDFPVTVLALFGLEAIELDDFLLDLIDHSPDEVVTAIQEIARDTTNPAISASEVLDVLAKAGASRTAESLASLLNALN